MLSAAAIQNPAGRKVKKAAAESMTPSRTRFLCQNMGERVYMRISNKVKAGCS